MACGRGCVVAVRIIGALVKENRLRVALVVVVVVYHGADRGVEVVTEEGIGPARRSPAVIITAGHRNL